jgi:hypothetical protein
VEITGIPLWDMPDHGGGASDNGIEIHPVTSVKLVNKKKMAAASFLGGDNFSSADTDVVKNGPPPSPTDILVMILLGIILGMTGQGLRVIVGIKKTNDAAVSLDKSFNEIFEMKRMVFSLFYAFAIGAIGGVILAVDYIGKPIDKAAVLAIIAASYAGTDFIEGFVNKNFKKK